MTKELEALQRIKKFYPTWRLSNREAFNLVESALKRLEQYENETQSIGEMIAKKLKAFEIIKNNDIDFKILKEAFVFNGSNKEQCEMYNVNQWQWVFQLAYPGCVNTDKYKQLSQEEYDILKEALL